jgi:EAL domain-containing protein (putative c-di-GMP-specific phosphodiesterase class I)
MIQAVRDEQGRLNVLKSYAILDTPRETDFDQLVRLAAQICEAPVAAITFVDERRQWFKAVTGLDMAGTDRAIAFCAHAIAGTGLFEVPDAYEDPRFAHNPLVTGTTGIRFYAGMPLVSPDGFALGTIAVIDRVPRALTEAQTAALSTLARQVMVALEYRRLARLFDSAVTDYQHAHGDPYPVHACPSDQASHTGRRGRCDADVSWSKNGSVLPVHYLALYQARAAGQNSLRFVDPDMQTAIATRAALEADMRLGLERGEFLLHYQPQVDARGYPTGAEALVRWRHPRRGLVSPAEFIPLAEETGLILPLGQWVLESACTRLASWGARPCTARLTMAVNVSARQFRHPDFVRQVLAVLERTGADPRRLKLELTEGLLIDNVEETVARMIALKAQGVGFSLDDFGTGYSSLAYLKRLPLDQLKIDQSFVRDVLAGGNDATIARTIITLGKSLGLAVIAEGVETEAQRDFLAQHQCDAFQGYLFSRPLAADLIDAFMGARTR